MNEIKISENTLNATLEYLSKKRYIEVFTLITAIQNDIRILNPKDEVKKSGDKN